MQIAQCTLGQCKLNLIDSFVQGQPWISLPFLQASCLALQTSTSCHRHVCCHFISYLIFKESSTQQCASSRAINNNNKVILDACTYIFCNCTAAHEGTWRTCKLCTKRLQTRESYQQLSCCELTVQPLSHYLKFSVGNSNFWGNSNYSQWNFT